MILIFKKVLFKEMTIHGLRENIEFAANGVSDERELTSGGAGDTGTLERDGDLQKGAGEP
jgi:hypothetical protein